MKKVHRLVINRYLLSWMGGFFDGEGYIGFYYEKGKTYKCYQVQIVNTEKDVLKPFLVFGGNIYKHSNTGKPNHKRSWAYTLRGRQIIMRFIITLLPYMKGNRRIRMVEFLSWNRELLTKSDQRKFLDSLPYLRMIV